MNETEFYIVKAKCGHVGRQKFIIKDFPVKAKSKKEAAEITRYIPRVKHDWKDAIISVEKVDENEYKKIRKENQSDPYFKAKSIQEQKLYCKDLEIFENEELIEQKNTRKARVYYRFKRMQIIEKFLRYS